MRYRKWKPSKAEARAFAEEMDRVSSFCKENGIDCSRSMDSFYFTLNGQKYRVSNHSVESSNSHAYDEVIGQTRELYHPNGRESDTIYIHASKTRIIEIYTDLKNGYALDGKGYRKVTEYGEDY